MSGLLLVSLCYLQGCVGLFFVILIFFVGPCFQDGVFDWSWIYGSSHSSLTLYGTITGWMVGAWTSTIILIEMISNYPTVCIMRTFNIYVDHPRLLVILQLVCLQLNLSWNLLVGVMVYWSALDNSELLRPCIIHLTMTVVVLVTHWQVLLINWVVVLVVVLHVRVVFVDALFAMLDFVLI